MEEFNRRPISGNNSNNNNNHGNGIAIPIAIPFDRGHDNGHERGHGHSHSDDGTDSTGVVDGRIPSHRSEQRESNQGYYCYPRHRSQQQQQPPTATHRDGNRGYQTSRTGTARRDSHNRDNGQREKDDDRVRLHVRSRLGIAAGSWHRNDNQSMVRC